MIGILSTNKMEETTIDVMRWIHFHGGEVLRFNGETLMSQPLHCELDDDSIVMKAGGVSLDSVQSVWFRRAGFGPRPQGLDPELQATVFEHMNGEEKAVGAAVYQGLANASWLLKPRDAIPHKWRQLTQARQAGLAVPASLMTNRKSDLAAFRDKHGQIILKSAGDNRMFRKGDRFYTLYTTLIDDEFMEELPDRFFPALAQIMIPKRYEIRVFYLDGACHSMAIFSQAASQTQVDFRRYNHARPNRTVPYRLPTPLSQAIDRFMKAMNLDTGSLDLIRAADGAYIFLEVNPGGQFGMVSFPCNYGLEEKVARYLMEQS